MSYTLISSERSPFGRLCRMFMIANKIPFEFRVLNFVDNKEDAKVLAQESPINKVPILIVDGTERIFDSRVIMNYLMQRHGPYKLSINDENIISAIYSCMDVSVTFFLMRHSGYDLSAQNPYLERQKERILRNLEYLKPWALSLNVENPKDWNYASMSLYSFLYWANLRAKTIQLERYPHFQKFLEQFSHAPGVKESAFVS